MPRAENAVQRDIDYAALACGGDDAGDHTEDSRQQQAGAHQQQSRPGALDQQCADRGAFMLRRVAEIALQHRLCPDDVLHRQGAVEAQSVAQPPPHRRRSSAWWGRYRPPPDRRGSGRNRPNISTLSATSMRHDAATRRRMKRNTGPRAFRSCRNRRHCPVCPGRPRRQPDGGGGRDCARP